MTDLIEQIRAANRNWKKASERGHAAAMAENNAIIVAATAELTAEGYTLAQIWELAE